MRTRISSKLPTPKTPRCPCMSVCPSLVAGLAMRPLISILGELQSLRFIFHVAKEDKGISCRAHYLVPEPRKRQLSSEELACLKAKDAFSIESQELRDELLGVFFDFVYPVLPIVDPYDFYRRYDAGGATSISPLLLQSMFLAASNASLSFTGIFFWVTLTVVISSSRETPSRKLAGRRSCL